MYNVMISIQRQSQRKESTSRNLNIPSGDDEERHFVTFKNAIHNEDITVMSISPKKQIIFIKLKLQEYRKNRQANK